MLCNASGPLAVDLPAHRARLKPPLGRADGFNYPALGQGPVAAGAWLGLPGGGSPRVTVVGTFPIVLGYISYQIRIVLYLNVS